MQPRNWPNGPLRSAIGDSHLGHRKEVSMMRILPTGPTLSLSSPSVWIALPLLVSPPVWVNARATSRIPITLPEPRRSIRKNSPRNFSFLGERHRELLQTVSTRDRGHIPNPEQTSRSRYVAHRLSLADVVTPCRGHDQLSRTPIHRVAIRNATPVTLWPAEPQGVKKPQGRLTTVRPWGLMSAEAGISI